MGRAVEKMLFLEWLNLLFLLCSIALLGAGGKLASAEGLDICCDNVSTDAVCHEACMEALESSSGTLSSIQIQALSSACLPTYTSFWNCVNQSVTNVEVTVDPPTLTTPGYYFCCNDSQNEECRSVCRELLVTEDWAVEDLSPYCSLTFPLDPVWNCILAYSEPTDPPTTSTNDSIPVQPPYADWARIQCCYQAIDERCRDSCLDLYTGLVNIHSWPTFQLDCIHRPSENSLSTCLADVTSPCKLGCTGLNFCETFNNRPSESFRQCNSAADRMAKQTFHTWANSGVISHPLITIFVNNINNCLVNMWKAVACITHVQPCHHTTHATQICREDCIQLLTKCSNSSIAPMAICDIIAPASSKEHCLSVRHFSELSSYVPTVSNTINNPCDSNPCAEGYFCAINHECQSEEHACTPYSCQPGCIVGDKPSFVVPEGSGVRVSLITETGRGNCFGYFNCSSDFSETTQSTVTEVNALGGTQVLPSQRSRRPVYSYCEEASRCTVEGSMTIGHKASLSVGCNFCTCFHGRLICTNRRCQVDENGNVKILSADCDCTMEHDPVCTKDGRTLPNSCIARCLGYSPSDYVAGDCGSVDACFESTCESDSRCIPQRRVCLSVDNPDLVCKQYTCVSVDQSDCSGDVAGPVCDTSNSQHTSLCAFLRTHKEFDYFGYCKPQCSSSKTVCGVDGKTYNTPCHAEDAHVAVDYYGPCRSHPGTANEKTGLSTCEGVVCPSLAYSGCPLVQPWDSCCPKCGAHVTILIDRELLQRNIFSLGKESLSSTDIISRLRYHISSLQCDLFGHLSVDGSLSILVLATGNASNPHVVEACNQEAVKLATFINNHTPMLASDPFLSHLVAAKVQSATIGDVHETTTDRSSTPFNGARKNECVLSSLVLLVVTALFFVLR